MEDRIWPFHKGETVTVTAMGENGKSMENGNREGGNSGENGLVSDSGLSHHAHHLTSPVSLLTFSPLSHFLSHLNKNLYIYMYI